MTQEKTLETQYGKSFYKVYGKGKAVVLIHGFGEDAQIWNQQILHLQNKYLLIVPDLLGSGKSTIENIQIDELNYISISAFANIIHQILIQEKIETCSIFGHSMGGYVCLEFAKLFPNMLQSFGLIHSTAFADSKEKIQTRLKAIEFIKSNGAAAFLKTTTPNLFAKSSNQKLCKTLLENTSYFSTYSLINYYFAMINREDNANVLKQFRNPILIIVGLNDQVIPLTQSLNQSYLPRLSQINILRKSAHMGMLEEPEKMTKTLSKFLEFVYTVS